jgi:hypothetical protein
MKLHSFSSLITNSSTDIYVLPHSLYKSVEEVMSVLKEIIAEYNDRVELKPYADWEHTVNLDSILTVEKKESDLHDVLDLSDGSKHIWQSWKKDDIVIIGLDDNSIPGDVQDSIEVRFPRHKRYHLG